MKILRSRIAHDGWLKLVVATVASNDGPPLEREFVVPGPAVAVLPYDPARRVALLVRQARPAAAYDGGPPRLLEAAAGKIDAGETAEEAIRREALEELGLQIAELETVADAWSSPGVSAERIGLYLASYAQHNRLRPGGGLSHEHETLQVEEVDLQDLSSQADRGEVRDLKTLTLVFALRTKRPELFAQG